MENQQFEQMPRAEQDQMVKLDLSDKNQALLVLVNAVKIGQSKGIYTLEEAEVLSRAIRAFVVPVPPEAPEA
jgi:hypothetical protein